MADISFQQGDEEWKRRRERCLSDLYYFASNVLGFGSMPWMSMETHALFCKFLQRQTGVPDIDQAPMQKLETPRGTGKTSIGTVASAIQLACANPNISIMIANEKAETAESFLATIKRHFETNDLLRALFPEVVPTDLQATTWKTSAATLRRDTKRPEPTFFAIGVGGTVTGMHPDVIIVDDPISKEAMENARVGSWEIMRRVNRWCNELKLLLNTQAVPFPWIRINGTRWWHDDVYDYVEKTYGYGETPRRYRLSAKMLDGRVASREVYRVGDVAVFRAAALEEGQPVYPKIYSLDKLEKLQRDDPELFACNLMNDPVAAAIRTFQDEWVRFYSNVDPGVYSYWGDNGQLRYIQRDQLSKLCVVDPAFTAGGTGDRTAIIVTGTDLDTGKHLLLEAQAEREDPKDVIDDVLNICARHHCRRLFVEAVAQQKGFIDFLTSEITRRGLGIGVDLVKPGGRNKDLRIEGLTPYFRAGSVLLHAKQLDFLYEYRSYRPGARYRDLLDALAYASEVWPKVTRQTGQSGKEIPRTGDARRRAELTAYYTLRGRREQAVQPIPESMQW